MSSTSRGGFYIVEKLFLGRKGCLILGDGVIQLEFGDFWSHPFSFPTLVSFLDAKFKRRFQKRMIQNQKEEKDDEKEEKHTDNEETDE